MTPELMNLVTLFLLGIAYLIIVSKLNLVLTKKYFSAKNTASYLLYAAVLVAAAIYLVMTADIVSDSNRFFMRNGQFATALLYSVGFFALSLVSTVVLTLSSFMVSSMLTLASEKEALENNDIQLAIMHSIILIALAFITFKGVGNIMTSFIPFPDVPF